MSVQLSPADVAERIKQASPPLLLDVREPWEVALCKIDRALLIPMNEIPARLGELESELDPGQSMVVYCHHGARSLQVVTFLQRQGFTAVHNLAGGIDAWARTVDPAIALY